MRRSSIYLCSFLIVMLALEVANPTTLFLAVLTAAGIGYCDYRLQNRRPAPVRVRADNHSRN
jgi:hypothetical protein